MRTPETRPPACGRPRGPHCALSPCHGPGPSLGAGSLTTFPSSWPASWPTSIRRPGVPRVLEGRSSGGDRRVGGTALLPATEKGRGGKEGWQRAGGASSPWRRAVGGPAVTGRNFVKAGAVRATTPESSAGRAGPPVLGLPLCSSALSLHIAPGARAPPVSAR